MPITVDTAREDPLVSFNFGIEVQGQITGFFTEVSGLGSETEIQEQKLITPTGIEMVRKIPGRLKWGDITLKRGITSNMDLWDWRKMIEDGRVTNARKNGSVVMYDQEGTEKARWEFVNAWPSKISGPTPKADSNDIGVEEVTLVHEYIVRIK